MNASTPRKGGVGWHSCIRRLVLPEQDIHPEHSPPTAPPAGSICQSPPPSEPLKRWPPEHKTSWVRPGHMAVQNFLSLWHSLRRHQLSCLSPPGSALLHCYDSHWQGLHFSWCHLLAMMNTTAINHVHEAFGWLKPWLWAHPRSTFKPHPLQINTNPPHPVSNTKMLSPRLHHRLYTFPRLTRWPEARLSECITSELEGREGEEWDHRTGNHGT